RLRKRPHDRREYPPFEVARDVGDRLAAAECRVRRRLDHVAAELAYGNLERGPRPQRRFLEEQRDVKAIERLRMRHARGTGGFQLPGHPQALFERLGTKVANREKPDGCAADAWPHGHVRYSALMRTYSALRSQVHMRERPGPPVPRSTSMST